MSIFMVAYKDNGEIKEAKIPGVSKINAREIFLGEYPYIDKESIISITRDLSARYSLAQDEGIILEKNKNHNKKRGLMKMLYSLRDWYGSITNKQRVVLLLVAFLVSLFPFIGWFFIAPWMLPLVAYLEFHRE